MSVASTAKALGVGWELVNQVALEACQQLVYDDPQHLDGVRILWVDEHVWKHTRRPGQPSSFVTVVVDLTPLVDGRGPARLLDMRPGRSAEVLRTWLQERTPDFRENVQVVTMDGFAGYATAVDQVLPEARKVMDPFHVVHLAANKLDLVPSTTPTRDHRASWTQGRSTLQTPTHPADQDKLPHRPAETTPGHVVGHR